MANIEEALSQYIQAREVLMKERQHAVETIRIIDEKLALTPDEIVRDEPATLKKTKGPKPGARAKTTDAVLAPTNGSDLSTEIRRFLKGRPEASTGEVYDGVSLAYAATGAALPEKKAFYNTMSYLKRTKVLKATGSRGSSRYKLLSARA